MHPETLNADFYDGRRSVALPFVVNDDVQVVAGPYAGRRGAVVGLDWAREPLQFLVAFGDGTDELLPAMHVRLIDGAV